MCIVLDPTNRYYAPDAAIRHPHTATRLGSLLGVVASLPIKPGDSQKETHAMHMLATRAAAKRSKHFARLGKLLGVKKTSKLREDRLPLAIIEAWCPHHCEEDAAHSYAQGETPSSPAAAMAAVAALKARRRGAHGAGDASRGDQPATTQDDGDAGSSSGAADRRQADAGAGSKPSSGRQQVASASSSRHLASGDGGQTRAGPARKMVRSASSKLSSEEQRRGSTPSSPSKHNGLLNMIGVGGSKACVAGTHQAFVAWLG